MDSRFAHLRQRDTSVSMLRVKMSRRRSQSQKENRDRAVNTRRQLEMLAELEMSSLDASIAVANMSVIQDKTMNSTQVAKKEAIEERLKQLERWKERKTLEKEKEKREKERKGVFKTGLYHAKDTFVIPTLPVVPAIATRAKETKVNAAPSYSIRVTRSMKQQQVPKVQKVQKPLNMQDPNTAAKRAQPAVERSTRSRVAAVKPAPAPAKTKGKVCTVEPVVRASSTRSANRPPVAAAPAVKDKPADVRTTRSRAVVNAVAPPSDGEKDCKETETVEPAAPREPEEKVRPSGPAPCDEKEEDMQVEQAEAEPVSAEDPFKVPSSFAPDDFVFQAPTGLSSFRYEPLTPRSADAFLTPSLSVSLPPPPVFNTEPQAQPSKPSPSKSPQPSPPRTSPTAAPPPPASPLESKHDVPYFRSEMANETDRLTALSVHWEAKVEDESIPEEMRDRMRTAIGQARLLMKERFKQFSGLVDDCELGRGEKITTCTDLQGFWDMVYFQVEDVNKKFDALKDAESRGWVEEHKPPPRQKKMVKKPSAAPVKPTGTKTAAKSRLAAVKAAMKAKQQAAEKAAQDAANGEDGALQNAQEPGAQTEPQPTDPVVFDGGFFQVESPAKTTVRRSSRLSAAAPPQASPCSNYLSPRRVTRRSLALAQTPIHAAASPAQLRLTLRQTPVQALKSQCSTPQSSKSRKDPVEVSVNVSPVMEALPGDPHPEGSPACQSEVAAELIVPTPAQPLPLVLVAEQDDPAESAAADLPLSLRIPLSPCKSPLPIADVPDPSACLSFTLSPCGTPSRPPALQGPVDAHVSVCATPESSALEEIPGLDFERYLQPSQRCSMSPRETDAMETRSPMAVDVEMASPRGQSEDLLSQQEAALPAVSSVLTLQSPQVQTAESALLLFTPDLKNRIRQSVCPSDLMVFTPPL